MASSDGPTSQTSGSRFAGTRSRQAGRRGRAALRSLRHLPPSVVLLTGLLAGFAVFQLLRAAQQAEKRRRAGRLGRSLRPSRGSLRHGRRDAHRGAQDPDCREVFRSFRGRGKNPSSGSRNRPGGTALRIRSRFSPFRRSVPSAGFRSAAFVLLPDRSGHPPFPFRRVP